jgi:hypothetical protein
VCWSVNASFHGKLERDVDEDEFMETNNRKIEWILLILVTLLLIGGYSEAATVHSCASSGERCVVKVEDGLVGDRVKILDEKARPIATGRIVKRRGTFAIITVNDSSQVIRKGYPVIINIDSRSSSLQWAASFTGQD